MSRLIQILARTHPAFHRAAKVAMKNWTVHFADGSEATVALPSDLSDDDDIDEFADVLAQEVQKLGLDPDTIEDWWPA